MSDEDNESSAHSSKRERNSGVEVDQSASAVKRAKEKEERGEQDRRGEEKKTGEESRGKERAKEKKTGAEETGSLHALVARHEGAQYSDERGRAVARVVLDACRHSADEALLNRLHRLHWWLTNWHNEESPGAVVFIVAGVGDIEYYERKQRIMQHEAYEKCKKHYEIQSVLNVYVDMGDEAILERLSFVLPLWKSRIYTFWNVPGFVLTGEGDREYFARWKSIIDEAFKMNVFESGSWTMLNDLCRTGDDTQWQRWNLIERWALRSQWAKSPQDQAARLFVKSALAFVCGKEGYGLDYMKRWEEQKLAFEESCTKCVEKGCVFEVFDAYARTGDAEVLSRFQSVAFVFFTEDFRKRPGVVKNAVSFAVSGTHSLAYFERWGSVLQDQKLKDAPHAVLDPYAQTGDQQIVVRFNRMEVLHGYFHSHRSQFEHFVVSGDPVPFLDGFVRSDNFADGFFQAFCEFCHCYCTSNERVQRFFNVRDWIFCKDRKFRLVRDRSHSYFRGDDTYSLDYFKRWSEKKAEFASLKFVQQVFDIYDDYAKTANQERLTRLEPVKWVFTQELFFMEDYSSEFEGLFQLVFDYIGGNSDALEVVGRYKCFLDESYLNGYTLVFKLLRKFVADGDEAILQRFRIVRSFFRIESEIPLIAVLRKRAVQYVATGEQAEFFERWSQVLPDEEEAVKIYDVKELVDALDVFVCTGDSEVVARARRVCWCFIGDCDSDPSQLAENAIEYIRTGNCKQGIGYLNNWRSMLQVARAFRFQHPCFEECAESGDMSDFRRLEWLFEDAKRTMKRSDDEDRSMHLGFFLDCSRRSHCRRAVLTFLCCWRYRPPGSVLCFLNRNVALMIAQMVWQSNQDDIEWGLLSVCPDDEAALQALCPGKKVQSVFGCRNCGKLRMMCKFSKCIACCNRESCTEHHDDD